MKSYKMMNEAKDNNASIKFIKSNGKISWSVMWNYREYQNKKKLKKKKKETFSKKKRNKFYNDTSEIFIQIVQ